MLILIRHGPPTETNTILGQMDVPLDPMYDGKEITLDILKVQDPIVISSPLSRARQTAQLFGFQRPILDTRIAEMKLGEFQGRLANEENIAKLMNLNNTPKSKEHGGESLEEFYSRVKNFYDEYKNEERPVIVFTHAGVIRLICTKINEFQPITYNPNYFEIVEINHHTSKFENRQIQISMV